MRRWLISLLLLATPASADGPWGSGPWHRSGVYRSGLHGGPSAAAPVDEGCGDPPGAPSVWLDARSVDGADNATLANLDPVATWVDLGSIGDDPAQATGGAQPAFIASCINSLPCVRYDGGDRLTAATAAHFAFMHDGTGATIYSVQDFTAGASTQNVVATTTNTRGIAHRLVATSAASYFMHDGTGFRVSLTGANGTLHPGSFDILATRLFDEVNPGRVYVNGTQVAIGGTQTFSALAPQFPLNIGSTGTGTLLLTGDIAQILIYADAHDDTERAAVEDWIECVYGEMPVS